MKNSRQQKILELIKEYDIDTQETLIAKLSEAGYTVTQTTVSRDIKQLNLVKGVTAKGTYKYVAPELRRDSTVPVLNSAITDSVTEIDTACNIVVVKTFPGMANAIAVCVDSLFHDKIVGSVAGDDTILLVAKTSEIADSLADTLKGTFGKK
ncbi:MAG: arginine repressor [Clostridia bacterium]|nr:arginine repressor [Clostridia bacterium]